MRKLLRIAVTLTAASLAFLGAWTLTDEASAHYTHCDPLGPPETPEPLCNLNGGDPGRYWAGQTASPYFPTQAYSNGIRGYVSAQDVALRDYSCASGSQGQSNNPNCDFLLNSIGTPVVGGSSMEIGYAEGAIPWPPWSGFNSATPKLYTEYDTTCNGRGAIILGTPPGNPRFSEFLGIRWGGQTSPCGGLTRYQWWFERGVNFAPVFPVLADDSQGQYGAQTEHFDNTHMEPNGLQCFGGADCTLPTYGYDLWLWRQSGGYWQAWTDPLPLPLRVDTTHCDPAWGLSTQCGSGYTHQWWQYYYSFRTTGVWP